MRKSLRVSALALMAAAMLGASATSASAYGGDESGSPQVNICGNTSQVAEAEAEEALAANVEQGNDGHHPTFCQTGIGNTINNINPDINVDVLVPENGA